jgi:uncharacterized membrane protein
MNSDIPRSAARIPGHPIPRLLVSFPIACFSGALVTDTLYAFTADMLWADFSDWLLAVGMLMAVLAAIAGLVDLVAHRHLRPQRHIWLVILGSLIVLGLGFLDNLVHSRDAWTSVVPFGLALSAVTVIVMLVTAWIGSAPLYRPDLDQPYAGVRT